MSGMFTGMLVGFVVLSIAYVLVSIYERSVKRQSLESDYDTGLAQDVGADTRDEYISGGMAAYRGSLQRRMLLLIYVIPMIAVAVTAYVVNLM